MIKDLWLFINIGISTFIFSILVIIIGLFDKSKKYTGFIIQLWSKWILSASFIDYKINGLKNIDDNENYVLISNHQSAMDVVLTFALIPKPISFFTKKELFYVPLFGWAMKMAGMVEVDRKNKEKSKLCVDAAISKYNKTNLSFLVYPEGTRTSYEKLNKFKKGGFIFSIKAKSKIVPLTLVYTNKNSNFRRNVTIVVDKPISTLNYKVEQKDKLIVKVKDIINSNLKNTIKKQA